MLQTHLTPPCPDPDAPNSDTPNASVQYAVSIDSYLPYLLRNCNEYCKIYMTTNTDIPDADAPDASDDDADDALDYA